MKHILRFYQGRYLPDFTSPLLIVAVVEWEKLTRSERFLIQKGKDASVRAMHHVWKGDYGLELQKAHGCETLVDFEVNNAVELIQAQLREQYKNDHQIAALYCPYRFEEIKEPKSYLISEQIVGRLPSLKSATVSRCRELRELALEISQLTPIAGSINNGWYDGNE